jgi:hypothetical protein
VRGQRADRTNKVANPTRVQTPVHEPPHGEDEDTPWKPPSNLDAPPPLPGMKQRWVRVALRAEADPSNLGKSLRDGWVPRRADTVPANFHAPTISHGEYAGCVGIHGMVLCQMPENKLAKRRVYYENLTKRQTQAVASDLESVNNERMPLEQQRVTKAIKGRQRVPVVASDGADGDDT